MEENMQKWLNSILIFCFLCFSGIINTVAQEDNIPEKPNILLIITDQQTANALSCTGNKYLYTPALDKLAESGVRFEKSYVTQPLCLPFRSSLQTSRYPHEISTINNGEKIVGNFPMLGNLVASAGYSCHYIGKWHVGSTPEKAGYKNYNNVGTDDKKSQVAVEFLLKKHDTPFFLTVSFMNPHNVCELARADAVGTDLPDGSIGLAPENLDELPPLPDNFALPENEPSVIRQIQHKSKIHYPTENWDELIWRQYLWGYYRLVEKVDAEIGKVIDALKKGDYEDNTVIIFTSDHGEGVAMHHWNQKQILYDQATRVPLIIRWKGITDQRIYPELVSNALDIPVTILDLVGKEKPESMLGISLLPVMEGKSQKTRKFVVSETMFARGAVNLGATGRMIRTKDFKYCIYDNGEHREQLFDMENDPGEMNNLAYKTEFEDVLNRHRELILEWMKSTNDNNFPYVIADHN
jgi:arylsulfatase A-like enzyme